MKILILVVTVMLSQSVLMAQQNSRALLPNQPILSQMTGNCYTHSGTDILTGIFLKENNVTDVNQPHPLLLGGLVAYASGRSNISSGMTCDFFNAAKNRRGEVCSVQGFNGLVAASGMSVANVKDSIGQLDGSMKKLHEIFNKSFMSVQDKVSAIEAAGKIIEVTCRLDALANLNDDRIIQLVDQSREIIRKLSPIDNSTPLSIIRSMLALGPFTLMNRAFGGAPLYSMGGRRSMNEILDQTYSALNKACVENAGVKHLPRVPRNFISSNQRFTCHDEIYKRPRLSGAPLKEKLDFIDRQVRAGYPTSIYLCSSVLYGKYPKVGGYRKNNGDCSDNGGGHAVTVTGIEYRNGKRFFKIRNSWGKGACSGLNQGQRICAQTGESGCPTKENAIDCKDGVYYMADDYLGLGLYGHSRLTVPRTR